jgi:26S proteasome regulatory subunit T2
VDLEKIKKIKRFALYFLFPFFTHLFIHLHFIQKNESTGTKRPEAPKRSLKKKHSEPVNKLPTSIFFSHLFLLFHQYFSASVTPQTRCKLKMLRTERVKDFLLMERDFVKAQERDAPKDESFKAFHFPFFYYFIEFT